jgi:NadR type nicotinamide-nucleotide adenylyltransferase
MPLKKIVVIGPESTGKSTLCEGLARHFLRAGPTDWVPEYAREYLQTHGMGYKYEDLTTIARGQLALEDSHAAALAGGRGDAPTQQADGLLFVDTDLYVMKVWSEYVFGRCETWILREIVQRKYDGYLLCRTDLPWATDPLREYPDFETRDRLFYIYKDLLVNQNVPWAEIGGTAGERLEHGVEAVKRLIATAG